MTYTTPDTITAGALVPITSMNKWTNANVEQQQADSLLVWKSPSTFSTVTSGSGSWLTIGNITVPTWATSAITEVMLGGVTVPTAGTFNTMVQVKIGSAISPNSFRLSAGVPANTAFNQPFADVVTGLTTGLQAVSIFATFTGGTALSYQVTSSSYVNVRFRFQ